MPRTPEMAGDALHDLLWASRTLLAAALDDEGRIVDANPALCEAAGVDPRGALIDILVAETQRPALRALVAQAGPAWATLTLGLWSDQRPVAEDRRVFVRRVGPEEILVVAEPDAVQGDRLVEQVLQLNDDLIAGQRELQGRQRKLVQARVAAEDAEHEVRRLEQAVMVGHTTDSLEGALRRLLTLAREALGAERAAALIVTDDGRHLRVRAAVGADIVGDVVRLGEGASGLIAAQSRPMIFDDISMVEGALPAHRELGGTLAGVPLRVSGRTIGVLNVSTSEVGAYGPGELRILEALGERAALAIGHAQLRERERAISETLHRSMLPAALPSDAALAVCARYLPRSGDEPVGGDFYDAMRLPGGRVALVIGDVAGKGLPAAAAMGQMRAALRAYALEDERPGSVLERLDRFVTELDVTATAMLAIADPTAGELAVASAGHPPLVLATAQGARLVTGALGPPLGAAVGDRAEEHEALPHDCRLLLYTDGLVERRDENLDDGLAALRAVVASAPAGLDALCDQVLAAMAPSYGWGDDVALLAARRP